jgi:DEAD/DEAH box helicase domain-containing protein
MLHLALLPYHRQWASFFAGLKFIVIDEVHTYRGILGCHMALVLRRLQRICAHYGAVPSVVCCSATISGSERFARQLTGLQVEAITRSGAPRGRRHVLLVDPDQSPVSAALALLRRAVRRGLRTIVYTQSRKLAELISLWAEDPRSAFAGRISAYRAGFLPAERRAIEAKLADGRLAAVVSTSALELGIDIVDLDVCLLVGYPGSIVATLQRSGRVGRSGQEAATVLIAGEDALDQYFLSHPRALIDRPPETAVVNPANPDILAKHLVCAADELPLSAAEPLARLNGAAGVLGDLRDAGALLQSEDGGTYFAARRHPQRQVDLRGSGRQFRIFSSHGNRPVGEIDGLRAMTETHPGAVYLHHGTAYLVRKLDLRRRVVQIAKTRVPYYTRALTEKSTDLHDPLEQKRLGELTVGLGRLTVTQQVVGFEKRSVQTREKLSEHRLDLPPLTFETDGFWMAFPDAWLQPMPAAGLDVLGGLHAAEHAAIGMLPLVVLCDRNDLGGFATQLQPQLKAAAVIVYDGVPGGAGLARPAFDQIRRVLAVTLEALRSCDCESGCPSCVQSPRCGSGNRPLDKAAAIRLLAQAAAGAEKSIPKPPRRPIAGQAAGRAKPTPPVPAAGLPPRKAFVRFGVLDLETQRSAAEVGGWHQAHRMGLSCAVLYDSGRKALTDFHEHQAADLLRRLQALDLIIGFNIKRFDYRVLSGYLDWDFERLPTLDMLDSVHRRLGFRLSLDHLARMTLGVKKAADGLQALQWWREGRMDELLKYCRQDVLMTRDLFLFGRNRGYLLFADRSGRKARVPVDW